MDADGGLRFDNFLARSPTFQPVGLRRGGLRRTDAPPVSRRDQAAGNGHERRARRNHARYRNVQVARFEANSLAAEAQLDLLELFDRELAQLRVIGDREEEGRLVRETDGQGV